ncbi:hypothetical protein PHAVU_007G265700 [Phaseolus vulgaris]|uniref:Uncharacterized protein n=1 Tax=Phaseolus vulgaris TaxID=3885 RepID=V7BL50_PHAVU|nr:hypothetical protein PHAVU_007G265700g [Phaseolus vulgaris]ESW17758.1 hypothetical protein PHAVU_007G265700g [Phaseolus vulgaris]
MSVMSKRVVFRPVVSHRRRSLLRQSGGFPGSGTRMGEAVGGTAAVCCCFSFGLANMVYLAMYKLPASLYQKMLRRKRQRRLQSKKEGLEAAADADAAASHVRRCTCGCCDDIMGAGRVYPLCSDDGVDVAAVRRLSEAEKDPELLELEKKMWEMFYESGFWRSPSQIDHNVIAVSVSAPNNLPDSSVN